MNFKFGRIMRKNNKKIKQQRAIRLKPIKKPFRHFHSFPDSGVKGSRHIVPRWPALPEAESWPLTVLSGHFKTHRPLSVYRTPAIPTAARKCFKHHVLNRTQCETNRLHPQFLLVPHWNSMTQTYSVSEMLPGLYAETADSILTRPGAIVLWPCDQNTLLLNVLKSKYLPKNSVLHLD